MSEKIDLAEIEEDAREHWVMRRDDTLALALFTDSSDIAEVCRDAG